MTGLSRKTDFHQLFEKDLVQAVKHNISSLVSMSEKKSRIIGRQRTDKSHLD